jgi:molecular chaperone DnaK (HSP70)
MKKNNKNNKVKIEKEKEEENLYYEDIVSIDLNSNNISIGIFQNEKIIFIQNEQGKIKTPSYISFSNEDRIIGNNAKLQIGYNPNNTIYNILCLFEKKFSKDEFEELKKKNEWSFKLINDENNNEEEIITPLIEILINDEIKKIKINDIILLFIQNIIKQGIFYIIIIIIF